MQLDVHAIRCISSLFYFYLMYLAGELTIMPLYFFIVSFPIVFLLSPVHDLLLPFMTC